ncbi:hypothetical protein LINPERPRIM_LOCUS9268, partial [Linum perenne]
RSASVFIARGDLTAVIARGDSPKETRPRRLVLHCRRRLEGGGDLPNSRRRRFVDFPVSLFWLRLKEKQDQRLRVLILVIVKEPFS